jgi:hypothetical protein
MAKKEIGTAASGSAASIGEVMPSANDFEAMIKKDPKQPTTFVMIGQGVWCNVPLNWWEAYLEQGL